MRSKANVVLNEPFYQFLYLQGFQPLLIVRLNDLVHIYTAYDYNSSSCKTLSKSLWVGRVSGEKGPE